MPFESGISSCDPLHDHDTTFILNNPFADRSDTSFTSAVKPKETRPAVRRRGSESTTGRARNDHDPWHSSHTRSRTLESGSGSHHPLVGSRSGSRSSAGVSAHDTRPGMKRLLSSGDPFSISPQEEGTETRTPSTREERVVLVHKIMPKDSLAGVALKYGVTLADLRRSNQLWASDSIHLRKVLYIPLEKARHARQFMASLLDGEDAHVESTESGQTGDIEPIDPNGTQSDSTLNNITIVRIPASQLSYFPPPASTISSTGHHISKARSLPRLSSAASTRPPIPFALAAPHVPASLASPSSSSSSLSPHAPAAPHARPPIHALGSLFSAFPARVTSSKVALISRLSSESTSASPSSLSDDPDWGHEMEDISTASSAVRSGGGDDIHARYRAHLAEQSSKDITMRARRDGDDTVELDSFPLDQPLARTPTRRTHNTRTSPRRHSKSSPRHVGGGGANSTDRPLSPSPSPSPTVIRTAQLQPSPRMQLPAAVRRVKSRDS